MMSGWKDVEILIRLVTAASLIVLSATFGTDLYQAVFHPELTEWMLPGVKPNIVLWNAGILLALLLGAWFTWPRKRTP